MYPSKALFEGANKNLIIYKYRGLKNQKFIFDLGRHAWINSETKRAVELSRSSEVGPGANTETAKIIEDDLRQKWHVNPCGGGALSSSEGAVPTAPKDTVDDGLAQKAK